MTPKNQRLSILSGVTSSMMDSPLRRRTIVPSSMPSPISIVNNNISNATVNDNILNCRLALLISTLTLFFSSTMMKQKEEHRDDLREISMSKKVQRI